ncbi:ATP-dependent sacrificial sulfur transferase LarE [Beduini massiliensis]|uniref:ATP-dependent sacrificial sulfur transferase LarE n=1 Tax=Beduini massiliensis TaxID=1585974 RepID=UPI00059A9981|nr:ATP-dependent sacrificial sulfur transferase LarE [Beduini massiliensis]
MDKLDVLKKKLAAYQKVAIAYSGGCDSNFLLNVAILTLGKENVLAVLCVGDMMSKEDLAEARTLLKDVRHVEIPIDVLSVSQFKHNAHDRCYHCKKMIMSQVIKAAHAQDFEYVMDGKNKDDEGVYRPGIQACLELGILSPMAECQLTKQEIREYSKSLGIVTHDKPANACLASRFNYDTLLTKEKLDRVDKAEALLHQLGIYYVRVRVQGELARIEVEKENFAKVMAHLEVAEALKALGFRYVTLDLDGITSGSYDKK